MTIPAGQASVTFTVDAVQNGVPEGMKQVQISATTAGLDTGLATFAITEVQLPDLVVSSVSAPASGDDKTPLSLSWTVTNSGELSRDRLVGGRGLSRPGRRVGEHKLRSGITFTGTLNPGQSYTQTVTIQSPSSVGQYLVRVVTDTEDSVQELSYTNNTGVAGQPYNDQALPIGLPCAAYATDRGIFKTEVTELVLKQTAIGRKSWLPLLVSWDSARNRKDLHWRILTVSERSPIVSPDGRSPSRVSWGRHETVCHLPQPRPSANPCVSWTSDAGCGFLDWSVHCGGDSRADPRNQLNRLVQGAPGLGVDMMVASDQANVNQGDATVRYPSAGGPFASMLDPEE